MFHVFRLIIHVDILVTSIDKNEEHDVYLNIQRVSIKVPQFNEKY